METQWKQEQDKRLSDANKKKTEQTATSLFSMEKKNINVIIYCGFEGIEKMVFASTDEEETIKKMISLKTAATEAKLEADKYTDEQKESMLDSEDIEVHKEYDRIFHGDNDPDRYCVMTFKDDKFECSCTELGVPPKESWLY